RRHWPGGGACRALWWPARAPQQAQQRSSADDRGAGWLRVRSWSAPAVVAQILFIREARDLLHEAGALRSGLGWKVGHRLGPTRPAATVPATVGWVGLGLGELAVHAL